MIQKGKTFCLATVISADSSDITAGQNNLIEESKTRGRVKATYKLEEMSDEENVIMEALAIKDFHNNRPKLKGVGVYTANHGNR